MMDPESTSMIIEPHLAKASRLEVAKWSVSDKDLCFVHVASRNASATSTTSNSSSIRPEEGDVHGFSQECSGTIGESSPPKAVPRRLARKFADGMLKHRIDGLGNVFMTQRGTGINDCTVAG
jgi:hypothetical protein